MDSHLVKKRKIKKLYEVNKRWIIEKDLKNKYHLIDMKGKKPSSVILQSYKLQNIFDRIILDCGLQQIDDKQEEMEKLKDLCYNLAQIQIEEDKE